jgi:endoglucanase
MKSMKRKRILSLLLAFTMILSILPLMAVNVTANVPAVSLELVGRTTEWSNQVLRGTPVTVTGNGTFSATLSGNLENRTFVNLALRSAGAGANIDGGFEAVGTSTAVSEPHYAEARIAITSITLTGASATVSLASGAASLDFISWPWASGTNPLANRVNAQIWNAWDAPSQLITAGGGLTTVMAGGGSEPDWIHTRDPAIVFPAGTTGITVNFTVSGVADTGDTTTQNTPGTPSTPGTPGTPGGPGSNPNPGTAPAVSLELVGRTTEWTHQVLRGTAVSVTGNGTYTATLGGNLENRTFVGLALRSAGAGSAGDGNYESVGTSVVVPESHYAAATITINSITLTGAAGAVTVTNAANLDFISWPWDVGNNPLPNRVNTQIWNTWDTGSQRIAFGGGATSVWAGGGTEANNWAHYRDPAVQFPASTTEIIVNFTVAGVTDGSTPVNCTGNRATCPLQPGCTTCPAAPQVGTPTPGQVYLMARDGNNWSYDGHRSAPQVISNNGTFTFSLTLPAFATDLVGLQIATVGTGFGDGPQVSSSVNAGNRPPASWSEYPFAMFTITNISVNGAPVTISNPTGELIGLTAEGSTPGTPGYNYANGLVHAQIWNTWFPGGQRVSGITNGAVGDDASASWQVPAGATISVTIQTSQEAGSTLVCTGIRNNCPLQPGCTTCPPETGIPSDTPRIQLVGMGTGNWARARSAAIPAADGTHSLTLTFAGGQPNIMQLAIMTEGASTGAAMEYPNCFLGLTQAPASWWNVPEGVNVPQLVFNSVSINGGAALTTRPRNAGEQANLVQMYHTPHNGFINAPLWNAWAVADNIINDVENFQHTEEDGTPNGIGFSAGAPVTTITVNFTISGIATAGQILCIGRPGCPVEGCTNEACQPIPIGDLGGNNVQLVLRDPVEDPATGAWREIRGPAVALSNDDDTYTVRIEIPNGSTEILQLGILTEGGGFDYNRPAGIFPFGGIQPAPPSWREGGPEDGPAEIRIDSILINGSIEAAPTRNSHRIHTIPAVGWEPTEGFVNVALFNAWWHSDNNGINSGVFPNTGGTPVIAHHFVEEDGTEHFGANNNATDPVTAISLPGGTTMTVIEVTFTTQNMPGGEVEVNKGALVTAIGNARNLMDANPNAPEAARTAFNNAIINAEATNNNANATQQQINDAVSALGTATSAFNTALGGQQQQAGAERWRGTGMILAASRTANTGPRVDDALQILRFLVGLSNEIAGQPNSEAWYASLITVQAAPGATPSVNCALQILRRLVGLSAPHIQPPPDGGLTPPETTPTTASTQPTSPTDTQPTTAQTPPSESVTTPSSPSTPVGSNPTPPVGPPPAGMEMNAQEIVNAMGVGWNLGNTFDSHESRFFRADGAGYHYDDETLVNLETWWIGRNANRLTTQTLITSLKDRGFNTIRIPVTWHRVANPDNNWNIRADYMARVQEVVDWAYQAGMHVIINTHHDEYVLPLSSGPASAVTETAGRINAADRAQAELVLRRFWEQIGTRFAGYSQRLIFEGLNEPRTVGSPREWLGGTAHEREFLNELNQLFVNVVRSQGGNNAWRMLMVPTYAANGRNTTVLREFTVPTDVVPNRLALSLHDYAPFAWAHDGLGVYQGIGSITSIFDSVQSTVNSRHNGIPVVLGEWGSVSNTNNAAATTPEIRAQHAEDFVFAALQRGWAPVWWDNGSVTGAEHGFGLIERVYPHNPFHQVIIDGMMRGRAAATPPG